MKKETTQAMVPFGDTAVTAPKVDMVPGAVLDAWDDATDEIIGHKIPLMKIVYPGSIDKPEGAANGMLYNNLTGDAVQSVRALLLRVQVRQALLEKYQPGPVKPALCESIDAIRPSRGSAMRPGPCREKRGGKWASACPMLEWSEGPQGKRVPPPCADIYALLLWDLDANVPVVFSVKRTGVPAFRKLKSSMEYLKARLAYAEAPEIPVNAIVPIYVSTVNQGTYFTPAFELDLAHRLPPDQARLYAAVAQDLGAQFTATSTAEITQTDDETVLATAGAPIEAKPAEFTSDDDTGGPLPF